MPFGETITYSALAKQIGSAARAVGIACTDNPFAGRSENCACITLMILGYDPIG
ncbi:MGMT family protein [Candidatus Methylobacter favarea]|uniref:MGMT family protein n=1 Tax=Candidatus Methylobacter favarea TaxID=2707345 RepID=UPI00157E2AC9